ncbi:MAG: hypothetical protein ACRDMZ_23865 [Solirubrobacteraceae bacterium]
MSTDLMTALTIAEAALLVAVLVLALTRVRQHLTAIGDGLGTLAGALATVESQHLRNLGRWVTDINAPLQTILSVLPGIAAKAAFVVRKVTGG